MTPLYNIAFYLSSPARRSLRKRCVLSSLSLLRFGSTMRSSGRGGRLLRAVRGWLDFSVGFCHPVVPGFSSYLLLYRYAAAAREGKKLPVQTHIVGWTAVSLAAHTKDACRLTAHGACFSAKQPSLGA
jgi:hypothetical protein